MSLVVRKACVWSFRVTVRFRSHCRMMVVLPVGELVTLRSRAPLTQISEVDTGVPATEMVFLRWRSSASTAKEQNRQTKAKIQCLRRSIDRSEERRVGKERQ